MKVAPILGARCEKRSTTSVEGVIGYPAANLAPAARAPSQAAWSPSRKCEPVRTPAGSACIGSLRYNFGACGVSGGCGHLVFAISVDGKIRAVHAAQIATAAFFLIDYVGWMVPLGIEFR